MPCADAAAPTEKLLDSNPKPSAHKQQASAGKIPRRSQQDRDEVGRAKRLGSPLESTGDRLAIPCIFFRIGISNLEDLTKDGYSSNLGLVFAIRQEQMNPFAKG
jgi:hypothetical protein